LPRFALPDPASFARPHRLTGGDGFHTRSGALLDSDDWLLEPALNDLFEGSYARPVRTGTKPFPGTGNA
jgi:hypothetical protein